MLHTHDDAIRFFASRRVGAERRSWALGDTVCVLAHPQEANSSGIIAYGTVMWLSPSADGTWDLVETVHAHERRRTFDTLDAACEAALVQVELEELVEPCPSCGGTRNLSFGERVRGAVLTWYASTSCQQCGRCSEADGGDRLPDDLREIELRRYGTWALVVRHGDLTHVLATLRSDLGLGMAAMLRLKAQLPGPILPGTIGEALRIKGVLSEKNISADATCEAR